MAPATSHHHTIVELGKGNITPARTGYSTGKIIPTMAEFGTGNITPAMAGIGTGNITPALHNAYGNATIPPRTGSALAKSVCTKS